MSVERLLADLRRELRLLGWRTRRGVAENEAGGAFWRRPLGTPVGTEDSGSGRVRDLMGAPDRRVRGEEAAQRVGPDDRNYRPGIEPNRLR